MRITRAWPTPTIDRDLADRALIARVAHLEGKALVNAGGPGIYSGLEIPYRMAGRT